MIETNYLKLLEKPIKGIEISEHMLLTYLHPENTNINPQRIHNVLIYDPNNQIAARAYFENMKEAPKILQDTINEMNHRIELQDKESILNKYIGYIIVADENPNEISKLEKILTNLELKNIRINEHKYPHTDYFYPKTGKFE